MPSLAYNIITERDTEPGTTTGRQAGKEPDMTKCIKCEQLEVRNGYVICREEDRKFDDFTGEPKGKVKVFYTVNDDELILESFKTLREAQRYADKN